MQKKKIAFKTLGCRLNHYETDAIASQFDKEKYQIVDFQEKADIYLINSCTVTHQSDHKVHYYINRANRQNKEALLVVMGCMANSEKELLEARPEIDYVIENEKKSATHSLIDAHVNGELFNMDAKEEDRFRYEISDRIFHTRSLVKIQDGCDNFCTFCIIPQVRGRAASRPVPEILQNVHDLLDAGYKEIVITGVNIGRYRHKGVNFEQLVKQILEIEGDFRLRISSLEPDGFTSKFFELFQNPKLTPHLHLCLQSGSDSILKGMKRMYNKQDFVESLQAIRKEILDFNFTTDIMVGFPGETEDDFDQTLKLIETLNFGHIHTFKYSVRKNTKAAEMPNQVPENLKTKRSEWVRKKASEQQKKYRTSFVGKTQKVLVEKAGAEYATGYGQHYVPVCIQASNLTKNEFYEAKIIGVNKDLSLQGVLL